MEKDQPPNSAAATEDVQEPRKTTPTGELRVANEALREEIHKRRNTEAELEQRVHERTAELRTANKALRWEIAEREQAEEKLRKLSARLEQRVAERTAELRASQEELIRNERLAALGQLTATVGHELRNPLGAMVAALYTIRQRVDADDEGLERSIARIERSVSRCDRIIDELLDFTRIRKLDLVETRIDDWLSELLDELPVPDGINVERTFGLAEGVVSFDQDRLRRVVINLYDNACQAMTPEELGAPTAGSRVSITTQATAGRVELTVADTGPGISEEVLPRIFEPLFSTKSFGVGLGLPIVQQILQQHGGGIEIDSGPAQGTRMIAWLPVSD